MARRRLLQLDADDQMDAIRKVLGAYASKAGHCPSSWHDVAVFWRPLHLASDTSGAPLDPAGTPYLLAKGGCDVAVDFNSEVPFR